MRLTKARITNFKSVLDSEWFTLADLTCLVGKNESGKTALLEALEKLNSVRPERVNLLDTSYPRMNWSEYEESGDVDVAVDTQWELSDPEYAAVVEICGTADAVTSRAVTASKDYNNDLAWGVPVDYAIAVEHAVKTSGLAEDQKLELSGITKSQDLLAKLKAAAEPTAQHEALLKELTELWSAGSLRTTVINYLKDRLPKFVYYDQYDRLPGRVSLDQLLAARTNGTLEQLPGSQVFLALLSMVGSTPEAINQISTSEELISRLEGVQTRLSKKIFKYWSQNRHLKVRFRFDSASAGDPAPFNTGKVFQTRIENTRHEATIRLDERSTGFIWFFSFLVWFSEVQKQHGDNLVVLLDEPGLTLHARAQADLLRYIREELLPKYQVIYTTHSPFMVDAANLLNCRTVEDTTGPDEEVLGTKVGDKVLSVDGDTLFPLQAALGYDLTQTLFVGEHCLLVEGPSDLLYIQWASDQLRMRERVALDKRWTVTPCGGITKVPSFMALFGGSKLHVAVLTDHGAGDKKKVREIRESDLLRDGHVITADMFAAGSPNEADVEDIIGRTGYLALITATYGLNSEQRLPAKAPAEAPERVTLEVENHFRTLPDTVEEYGHFAPSRYLIEHADALGTHADDALDRFEALFQALNALL